MTRNHLQDVADKVIRRAKRQGFVLRREICAELERAGLPKTRWKEVLTLARSSFSYQQGRYVYVSSGTPRMRVRLQQEQQQQRVIQRVVRRLIRTDKEKAFQIDRRQYRRFSFLRPVGVTTEDHRELHLLCHDISLGGIGLISPCSLVGQVLHVWIAMGSSGTEPNCFRVRVLWSSRVGDNLYESGGVFLELVPAEKVPLKLRDGEMKPNQPTRFADGPR